eukprot:CAMPEP_0176481760 /NCGR_PEP_ID=MMETSP0200_2-20121128/3003_1 /TAXON_ID=947934 /ORGANISM="Chaetoceros sp., Strain GSL56" /LENGTH=1136 /DNA_ID=CAMNT_0017878009 /DNA_START=42 /DNA_END=3452 /DNA_ORIENTATION=-
MKRIQYPSRSCFFCVILLCLSFFTLALSHESKGPSSSSQHDMTLVSATTATTTAATSTTSRTVETGTADNQQKLDENANDIVAVTRHINRTRLSCEKDDDETETETETETDDYLQIGNSTQATKTKSTKDKSTTTANRKRTRTKSSSKSSKSLDRKSSKSTKKTESSSVSQSSTTTATTTNLLPRGTQITGAGHHTLKNKSIFATAAASVADPTTTTKGHNHHYRHRRQKEEGNPIYGRIYAKYATNNQLLLYFPREKEMIEIMAQQQDHTEDPKRTTNIMVRYVVQHDMEEEWRKKDSGWIPMEGIYGVYMLPSGPHLVLITNSHGVYQIPNNNHNDSEEVRKRKEEEAPPTPLMHLRRILSMEIVRIPLVVVNNADHKNKIINKRHRGDTERRQYGVLRRALKEHEFYFTVPAAGDGMEHVPIQDVTHTLQRSFVHWRSVLDNWQERKQKVEEKGEIDNSDIGQIQKNESHTISLDSTRMKEEQIDTVNDTIEGREEDENDGDSKQVHGANRSKSSWWSCLLKSERHKTFNRDCSFQRPDSRFFWNEKCLDVFLQMYESEANDATDKPPACHLFLDYSIPVTSAFVGVQRDISLVSNATADAPFSVKYDQLLISRRSKYRTGTRFTKRGADSLGDVANFVETEQICIVVNDTMRDKAHVLQEVYSHVQTRGSIPLRWSSPTDIKTYRPRVMIGTNPLAQARAVRNHLVEQLSLYSSFVDNTDHPCATLAFVNLIDKHSDQGRLGRTFDSVLDAILSSYQSQSIDSSETTGKVQSMLNPDSVSHVWFDFHAECKKGRWDRLKYLLDDVRPCLDSHGYLCVIPSSESLWEIVRIQNGVVRTNCMDCLDRTNVVQSMFGRYILFQQFSDRFGLKGVTKRKLPVGYNVAYKRKMLTLPWNTGEVTHRLLWADNADAISRLYAGTPALKGDFTRTGRRTKRGALDDGVNSVTRFYLNNFLDADRQEGMDLLTGYATFEDSDANGDYVEPLSPRHARLSKKKLMDLFRTEKGLDSRLSLTWLPGDLQSHLRSAAFSSLAKDKEGQKDDGKKISSGLSLSAALKDIDRRAMSNEPWWITVVDELHQDDVQKHEKESTPMEVSILKPSGGGHVLAALIASFKAPISTAIVYICLMIPGISKD